MNPRKKLDFNFGKLIERYRWPIGAGLLVLILLLGGYLLWRENYQKPDQELRITNYESRITDLENKVAELEKAKTELSNNQPANPLTTESGAVAGASTTESTPKTAVLPTSGKVNINIASTAELDTLPGIGPAYAGRIIDYRNANGGFKSIDEIKNVKGIGDKTFDKFKDRITI